MTHVWTWEEIARDWLRGARIANLSEVAVEAFNRVERLLGRDWLESCRRVNGGGAVSGSAPTLAVVSAGRKLVALENARNAEGLLSRIRQGDRSALSELTGLFLCRGDAYAEIEIGEPVLVSQGKNPKVPDFRLRSGNDGWTYVEVTAPNVSELQREAQQILDQLASCLDGMPTNSSIEVFLRREPIEAEVKILETEVAALATAGRPATKDLPGLALLLANETPPGQVVLSDHGEPSLPRIGASRGIGQGNVPLKHITVRIPFSDGRAESFLKTEAKQLPKEYPGLIFVDVSRAPSALTTWEALLRCRFQQSIHTRVSAVCLFTEGIISTPGGETTEIEVKIIVNDHAKNPAPRWIIENLLGFKGSLVPGLPNPTLQPTAEKRGG